MVLVLGRYHDSVFKKFCDQGYADVFPEASESWGSIRGSSAVHLPSCTARGAELRRLRPAHRWVLQYSNEIFCAHCTGSGSGYPFAYLLRLFARVNAFERRWSGKGPFDAGQLLKMLLERDGIVHRAQTGHEQTLSLCWSQRDDLLERVDLVACAALSRVLPSSEDEGLMAKVLDLPLYSSSTVHLVMWGGPHAVLGSGGRVLALAAARQGRSRAWRERTGFVVSVPSDMARVLTSKERSHFPPPYLEPSRDRLVVAELPKKVPPALHGAVADSCGALWAGMKRDPKEFASVVEMATKLVKLENSSRGEPLGSGEHKTGSD